MASEQPIAPQPGGPPQRLPPGLAPFPSWGTKKKKRGDLSCQSEKEGEEPSVDGHTHTGADDGLAKLAGVGTKQEEPNHQTPGAYNLPKSEPLARFAGHSLHLTAALAPPHQDLLPDTPPPARAGTSPVQAAGPNQQLSPPQREPPPQPSQALPCTAAPAATAKAATAAADDGEVGVSGHLPSGLHHLTRHWLPEAMRGQAVLRQLGAADLKAAESMIKSMGQRDLRQAFQRVYTCETQSYNNNWLRRKLMEAVGLKATPSPRHARGGPAAAPAARSRPTRPPAPRRPAPAAAAGPSAASFVTEISKKVTRKAAVAAAEADAVAALRTMMAGGMEGDSSWGGGSSWGAERGEEGGEEEPSQPTEGLPCEEEEPGGQKPGRQQQQQQQRQKSRQQQQEEGPPSPTAHWKAALSRAGSGGLGPGGSGGGGSTHQTFELLGALREGKSSCPKEGIAIEASVGSRRTGGSANGPEANGSAAAAGGPLGGDGWEQHTWAEQQEQQQG